MNVYLDGLLLIDCFGQWRTIWERWVRRVRSWVFSSTKVKQDVTSVLLLCGAWGAGGATSPEMISESLAWPHRLFRRATGTSAELTRVRQIVIKRSAQSRGAFSAPVPHLCIFSNLLELSRTLFNSTPLLSLSLDRLLVHADAVTNSSPWKAPRESKSKIVLSGQMHLRDHSIHVSLQHEFTKNVQARPSVESVRIPVLIPLCTAQTNFLKK